MIRWASLRNLRPRTLAPDNRTGRLDQRHRAVRGEVSVRSHPGRKPRDQVGVAPGQPAGAQARDGRRRHRRPWQPGRPAGGRFGSTAAERRAGDARDSAPPVKSAQAWEVEAGPSTTPWRGSCTANCGTSPRPARSDLSAYGRRDQVDVLIDPLLDASVPDGGRAALVVNLFCAVLAARLLPLLAIDLTVVSPCSVSRALIPTDGHTEG